MTRFRGTRHHGAQSRHFVLTATNQDRSGLTRVRELHPIPLFSENKSCVSGRKTGSRICHKSRNVFSFICGYLCDDYYNHMFRLPSSPFRTAMRFFYDRARGTAHSARKPAPSSRKV